MKKKKNGFGQFSRVHLTRRALTKYKIEKEVGKRYEENQYNRSGI